MTGKAESFGADGRKLDEAMCLAFERIQNASKEHVEATEHAFVRWESATAARMRELSTIVQDGQAAYDLNTKELVVNIMKMKRR